jgi:hypothetical protein
MNFPLTYSNEWVHTIAMAKLNLAAFGHPNAPAAEVVYFNNIRRAIRQRGNVWHKGV